MSITIYTDGSSLGNPGPGGWAALIIHEGKVTKLCGNEPDTTNNRMELLGVIKAFEWVGKNFKNPPSITVKSDSSLVIKTMTENWKTKKNTDLWKRLSEFADFTIKWEWVKGHAKNKYNNQCDELAREQASKIASIPSNKKTADFFCTKCNKETKGILSQKTPDSPIRIDCEHCGKYIRFAEKTKKNLGRIHGSNKQESIF
ncbi:MAG: ribonuclease H, ribonuclease HI [Candidatus Peregrinibacteria bacterium GW2011_GWF2_43_17]|nr:MAG: ribonuclease H, ribonuclease HI [Candidatus Peregrinibacteria bacterium GW2011_GWF2_43_17]KKT20599.1 MAG: Ribonuclease H [Candidatus Peregrinibacteria bacterium GW2011_GWA2_43_8]HAU39882.1 hypothetical protein [Candidatus Peregrinibacteria bacterium]